MSKVTNSEAEFRIRKEEAFVTHNGTLRGTNLWSDGVRRYIVYSYNEPIASVTYEITQDGNQDVIASRYVWVTKDKFSKTTSRHTSIARRALVESKEF
jgi:hypothetical protein